MNPKVLVGMNTADDAGVYQVRDDLAVAFTVDYFTPVVDDPYDFGAVAVANALSDCYAMGVQPSVALNIVGFPIRTLPIFVLDRILKGGTEKAEEAGVSIVGGHTIDDPEPKYGMAVIGFAHPNEIVTNAGARKGDLLILTKPLGIGIITTGIKQEVTPAPVARRVIDLMKMLNRDASRAMMEIGVDACTDVTGFGLLGHLWEMCTASKLGASIALSSIPVMPEAWKLAEGGTIPGGAYSNREYVIADVTFDEGIGEIAQLILSDPQTSGGLLMAVPPEKADRLIEALKCGGAPVASVIGEIVEDLPGRIQVTG